MNRKIKFRGKAQADEKWVYGWFRMCGDEECIFTQNQSDYIIKGTSGQYSGMNDSNDNEIYEGQDVILESGGKETKGKVHFKDGCFILKLEGYDSEPELKYYIDMEFCRIHVVPDYPNVLCKACSEASGSRMPIYHQPPECK